MHQPRWLVEHGSNKLEPELLEDALRDAIVGMVPGIDFREPRFMPGIFEHAVRRFRREAYAPARLYEMKADLEIRLAWRVDPRPQPAAADELAIAVSKQRPILNAIGPFSLDLGVESFPDLRFGWPRESISAVTAGSPHNSIANGRSSACHDRATRRQVLNFSICAVAPTCNCGRLVIGPTTRPVQMIQTAGHGCYIAAGRPLEIPSAGWFDAASLRVCGKDNVRFYFPVDSGQRPEWQNPYTLLS